MATQQLPCVQFTFEVGNEAPTDAAITRAIIDYVVSDACPDVVRTKSKGWIEGLLFNGVKLLLITAFLDKGASARPSDVQINDTYTAELPDFVLIIKVQEKPI